MTLPASAPSAGMFETAKMLFYRAVDGAQEDLPESIRLLNQLGGREAQNPKVVAYSGAAELLQAKQTAWFIEKGRLARDGVMLEDQAVAQAPDDLEIRFLRGVTNYQLPGFMGRWDTAVTDLTFVAKSAEQAARDGRLDRRSAAADLYYYGNVLQQQGQLPQAKAAWEAAVRVDPQGKRAQDAREMLAK